MASWIALLRGVNVGGNNLLPMKSLASLFEAAGCARVRTYIQSGNVVFDAAEKLAARVPSEISRAIAGAHGFDVSLQLRSADELAAIARKNPWPDADPARLLVMFLAEAPSKKQVSALDPKRSPPDEFVVRGREIYLHAPNGFGGSKLSNAWFDKQLGTVSTGRNWRTVLKLLEMAAAPPGA
jgi:uncharacterized protein (DUF1697 family)